MRHDWNNPTEAADDVSLIFNCTQDALFLLVEEAGRLLYRRNNESHQAMTGYDGHSLYGHTPCQILGEDSGKRLEEKGMRCLETGRTVTYEETLHFPTATKSLLTKLTPISRPEQPRMIVGSRVDITSQTLLLSEKEQLIREMDLLYRASEASLKRFITMFDAHTAIMLLIEPQTGRIVDANPAATEFYGYPHDELTSMAIQDINRHPPEEVRKQCLMALESGKKHFLFPHRIMSGEIRLVDVYSCPVELDGQSLLYSIIFDVTERERSKQALFREKEFLDITLHSIGDGVVTTDTDGRIIRINPSALEILGHPPEDVLYKRFSEVFVMRDETTDEPRPDIVSHVLRTGKVQELANHTVLLNRRGERIPIADSAAPIKTAEGDIQGAVLVFRNVSAEKEKKDKILYLSYHDTVTGLYNRRFFHEELHRIDHGKALPLSIVMGDVNGLKMTNDVFGHETGDLLLRTIGGLLQENTSGTDIAIRWGGDEFVVFMPNTSREQAESFVAKMNRVMSLHTVRDVIQISISFGITTKEAESDNLENLLQEAEESMYRVKLLEGRSLRNNILNTVIATLGERSSETKAHAGRLERHCVALGRKLNLRAEALSELALLSALHDIGKIGIDQNVLQKPGPLNEAEWVEMHRHPEIGYRIAQNIPELANVSEAILCHHEKWDGTGYPRGLAGDEIPVSCRILAVADAYDAMVNDRVYRRALTQADALAEIRRNAGTQFDPRIVSLFLAELA